MNMDFTASFAKDLRNLRDQRILKHVQRVIHAIENAETLADLKHLKNRTYAPLPAPPLNQGRGA